MYLSLLVVLVFLGELFVLVLVLLLSLLALGLLLFLLLFFRLSLLILLGGFRLLLLLLLCVRGSKSYQEQQQNRHADKSNWFHESHLHHIYFLPPRSARRARGCDTDSYLSDLFLGDFLLRVETSNFAEAGAWIALLITISFALTPFP